MHVNLLRNTRPLAIVIQGLLVAAVVRLLDGQMIQINSVM